MTTPLAINEFPRLFAPIALAGHMMRNRVVLPAIVSNYAREHRITERSIAFYAERARGGVGMIVTEGLSVHPSSAPQPGVPSLFDPGGVPMLQRLAAAVEGAGCRLVGQLWHVGRQQLWNPIDAPVAPSALPDPMSWVVPHALRTDEIAALVESYANGARCLQKAGFSGAELHGAHGYLITQFLSPWSNVRTDDYGGDVDGRTRFVREVIRAVRAACGSDFILGLKMPGDEGVAGGIDADEAARLARRIVGDGGIDYIGFAQGNFSPSLADHVPDMSYPPGPFMALQKRLRAAVGGLPVLAFGKVTDAAHAETLLAEGVGDLIGLGRALIADAALAAKALAGEPERTRTCIFCNNCWGEIHAGKPMACIVNPHLATAGEADRHPSTAAPKHRVVVVGAGVAGLEAAWVAAARGHDVTLLGSARAGGKARLEARLPGREEIAGVYEFQLARIRQHGVRTELDGHVDAGTVLQLAPERVIVATGSSIPALPLAAGSVPSIDARTWVAHWDGSVGRIGGTIVLFDQDQTAGLYALADLLARWCDRLVLMTPRAQLGRAVPYVVMLRALRRLHRAHVCVVHGVVPRSFVGGRLIAGDVFGGDDVEVGDVAQLVHAIPRVADDRLLGDLVSGGLDARAIGDCHAPRSMMAAVHEGHRGGSEV